MGSYIKSLHNNCFIMPLIISSVPPSCWPIFSNSFIMLSIMPSFNMSISGMSSTPDSPCLDISSRIFSTVRSTSLPCFFGDLLFVLLDDVLGFSDAVPSFFFFLALLLLLGPEPMADGAASPCIICWKNMFIVWSELKSPPSGPSPSCIKFFIMSSSDAARSSSVMSWGFLGGGGGGPATFFFVGSGGFFSFTGVSETSS
mmetsp:Transcript_5170/g.9078  ORF Transcript_5170/g.9078 Transcript_5170/m.9078 type:complete len:200 (+) Transcript_5170:401-1000(+)